MFGRLDYKSFYANFPTLTAICTNVTDCVCVCVRE